MQNVLALAAVVVAYLHAHPRESAVLSLALALAANWTLGTLDALIRGDFSFAQWPRIIASQLASTEVKVIGGMVATAALAALSKALVPGGDAQLVNLIVDQVLNAAAAAAGLYSVALWREDARQLQDIEAAIAARLTGSAVPPRRNRPRHAPQVTGVAA